MSVHCAQDACHNAHAHVDHAKMVGYVHAVPNVYTANA